MSRRKSSGERAKCKLCGKMFTVNKKGQTYCSVECVREHGAEGSGRPTVMTEIVINKLEEVFALGGSDGEACLFADISKQTLYDYQKKFPEFVDRKAALKKNPILKARREVIKGLEDNHEFSLKYLERKRSDEFSLKQKIEHDGEVKIVKRSEELDEMALRVEQDLKNKKI